uniref:hypothetical protein n=1 Tax=Alistipes putredinis TaxID=28117 RepID=UPI003FD7B5BB
MNKKWIIYIVLIVVAFVLIVVFSKNIYFWLSNQLWKSAPRGRFRRRLAAGTLRRQEKRDAARQRQLSDSKL